MQQIHSTAERPDAEERERSLRAYAAGKISWRELRRGASPIISKF